MSSEYMPYQPSIRVKLDEGAYLPTREHETDAGADICTPVDVVVPAHGSAAVHTGVHVETPSRHASILMPKSGLNLHADILSFGVIDEGFSGEIIVKLYNLGDEDQEFKAGSEVTQMLCMPVLYPSYVEVEEIQAGERGTDGYGSTGLQANVSPKTRA